MILLEADIRFEFYWFHPLNYQVLGRGVSERNFYTSWANFGSILTCSLAIS